MLERYAESCTLNFDGCVPLFGYIKYNHESGPALPGISCAYGELAVPGDFSGTHHANVVPVEQRLSKLGLLPALRRSLTKRIQLEWSLFPV